MYGIIRKLMHDKYYGFITDQKGENVFFHSSGLEKTTLSFSELSEGMKVEFNVIPGDKGPRAIEIRVIQ